MLFDVSSASDISKVHFHRRHVILRIPSNQNPSFSYTFLSLLLLSVTLVSSHSFHMTHRSIMFTSISLVCLSVCFYVCLFLFLSLSLCLSACLSCLPLILAIPSFSPHLTNLYLSFLALGHLIFILPCFVLLSVHRLEFYLFCHHLDLPSFSSISMYSIHTSKHFNQPPVYVTHSVYEADFTGRFLRVNSYPVACERCNQFP